MADLNRRQLNRRQIEDCLKSAVEDIKPDVLNQIDLTTPQEKKTDRFVFKIRRRVIGTLVAACLCMIILAGGTYTYQNGKVDSVIGIDVNPSVELSVNKKNKVLSAKALNQDAERIMQDMDLKGVNLNVAVNAIIGSLVTHGYLDDLDNAILVTVSNDSLSKASMLRSTVVSDIKSTLEEKQLNATVIDQQVVEEDAVKKLSDKYNISYGKAYFLKELIEQNASLSMNDMKKLAPMTMEEIADEIGERSYAVTGKTSVIEETTVVPTTQATTALETKATEETTTVEETTTIAPTTVAEIQSEKQAQATPSGEKQTAILPTEEEMTQEQVVVTNENIKIDDVDYDSGSVMVYFKTKVKWKNPTVSVKDSDGNTYSAKVVDTDSDYCEIDVAGLDGGEEYIFVLGGISPKVGRLTTVKGVFETPVIGDGNADPDIMDEESEETETTKATEATTKASEAVEESEQIQHSSQETIISPSTEEEIESTSTQEETITKESQEDTTSKEDISKST